MNEKMLSRMRQRVQQWPGQLENLFFRDAVPLQAEFCVFPEAVPFSERLKGTYKPIHTGESFGKKWDHAWFHVTGSIPEMWKGRKIALRLNFGGETLVADKEGHPLQGLTSHSVFFTSYLKEYVFLDEPHPDKIDLWCETVAMTLVGQASGSGTCRCSHLEAGWVDEELWDLKFDVQTAMGLTELDQSARSRRALTVLDEALSCFAGDLANASATRKVLQKLLSLRADDGEWTANAVGHAHIDVAWLWPVHESRGKAIRTFSSQIRNMERYPGYVFGASQAQLYAFVKEYAPDLFNRIRERVKEGRWETQGGMWVEADCNLISGESMVRQFLHGKNFFRDEFGVDVKNLWLPDVFGYSAALPQIMKKAGCDFFLTQKISWNQINLFPYHAFTWRGIDGSEVLTHFAPENTYNSSVYASTLAAARNRFSESDIVPEFMTLFGMGDGGGGPKEDHIERGLRIQDLAGIPKVKFGRADEFFQRLQTYADRLPVWSGELYLEMHRGTYTTQSRTKRNNRQCEQQMVQAEMLWSCLPLSRYPAEKLDRMWKSVLCKQFHDILPGSSIMKVYEITEREHAEILAECRSLEQEAAANLGTPDKECVTVFNSLSYPYRSPVKLSPEWAGSAVCDESGHELTCQTENGCCFVQGVFPPQSFTVLRRSGKSSDAVPADNALILENSLIRYEFDTNGRLLSAFDKTMQKEMLSSEGGNCLNCYRDTALRFEAWDIEKYYREMPPVPSIGLSARKTASGPVRQVLEFQLKVGRNSTLKQQVVLAEGSKRLDFVTEADWHEDHQMLRVNFALACQAEEASCDIQYGYIRRPTHTNTSWDEARFEVCAHRYVDLSTADGGAALLNDCKYGWHLGKNTLDLALLRSPYAPQLPDGGLDDEPGELTDQGKHLFTYSFLPHEGILTDSSVIAEAACLNRNVQVFPGAIRTKLPVRLISGTGVSLEVLKKAEKEECLVVRLVETAGRCSSAVLETEADALTETDLTEWHDGARLHVTGGRISLLFHPFEIRTFKLPVPGQRNIS